MSITWQHIIVGIVVLTALVLAIRSIIRAIKHKKSALNPCESCPLISSCKKKNPSADCKEDINN
ncbi:MAG: FeoB-associated Cys-rich membrane protein [Muribaculaceae bacterium]|nr:FeoB-associated Cys-rich membrane protein [Muribaculaceae bacterium]